MVEKEEEGGSRKASETGKNVINVREEEEFEESQSVCSSSDSQEHLAHNHCSPWSKVNLEFAMGIIYFYWLIHALRLYYQGLDSFIISTYLIILKPMVLVMMTNTEILGPS